MSSESSYTKTTEVVVQFDEKKVGQDRFEHDCDSIRNILGQAFPEILEKNDLTPIVRHYAFNEVGDKIKNLDEFEEIAKKYGIRVSYKYMASKGFNLREVSETLKEWKYELGTYLEYKNPEIRKVVDSQEVSGIDIIFNLKIVSVETPQGDVSGNHFWIRCSSRIGEEHLKTSHKNIVHALLVELNKIEEIKTISYHCGDVDTETTIRGKISCQLVD